MTIDTLKWDFIQDGRIVRFITKDTVRGLEFIAFVVSNIVGFKIEFE